MTIIVVGAGVVGCAIAYELASRGASVRIVDTRAPGQGATRASAGMLAPYVEGHLPALRTLGVRSLALYDRFVDRVVEESGEPVEYERSGTLQVALDPGEREELIALARTLAEAGVGHAWFDAADARAFEPGLSERVAGALHVNGQGYVAAGALTRALATAAARRGAALTTTRVESVEGGDTPRVVTATETLPADAVVIAAGTWAGAFEQPPRQPGHVTPIRGQILQLRLASRPVSRIAWGSRCYLVPWHDGTVLVGATVEDVGFDEHTTVGGVRQLLDAGAALVPALAEAAFVEARAGLRPMTRDELPVIGRSSTMRQVFYATGHYRNGVLLAPLTAALVADLVLEGREDRQLSVVRPDRLGL